MKTTEKVTKIQGLGEIKEKHIGSLDPNRFSQATTESYEAKALDILFSNNENYIIQTSDFSDQDIRMSTALEIIDLLVMERFCFDAKHKLAFRELKKRIYMMKVSKGRMGRTEIFDSLGNMKELEILKQRVGNITTIANKV